MALANGRFPAAQAILTVPGGDGQTVYMRATFGLLISHDGARTWRWICERALGYEGTWDPPVAVTRDGTLWVGQQRGLVATKDGCTIDTQQALAGETIKDLTTDPKGETLWALTGTPEKRASVWKRPPSGTWQRVGQLADGWNPLTIEVAPSRPSRLYVSGEPYDTIRGTLVRSDDGGKTWTAGKNDLAADGPFFIADVDPKNADRVLVRHLHTTGSDLLLTTDAGKSFTNVLSMKSAMFGFAKSEDGTTYWAGSGLPEHGIFRSTDRGAHFEHVSSYGVLCLWRAPGGRLLVCENPLGAGTPAVAVSTDDGRTVTPLSGFAAVEGPLTCAGDAGASVCADAWAATQALLVPTPAPPASAPPAADAGVSAAPPRRSSCGCSIIGGPGAPPDPAWLTTGLAPLLVWARARGRRGSRRVQSGP
ncbi:MAG: BNR/Asp-box repeat domain protein [Labilithrix sp.]|nr:BNR/Asp-box repeat domain protein [Labilithrix sp.]